MFFCELRHFARKLGSAENVEVKVLDRLASIVAAVRNNAVAVYYARRFCNSGDFCEDIRHNVCIGFVDFVYASDVRFRNNENVNGRLGRDIVEGENFIVLISFFRGDIACDYFAKKGNFLPYIL